MSAANHFRFHLRPTARATRLSLSAALLVGSLAVPLLAQTIPSSTAEQTQTVQRHWAIPAGELSVVLHQIAQESGIFISGAGDITQGKRSPSVQGQLTVQQALQTALTGTALEFVAQGDNSYTLRAIRPAGRGHASGGEGTLPEVVVTAASLSSSTTEGNGSYAQLGPSSSAAGLQLTQRETPQSVSVLTREQLDDQNLTTLNDAMRAVPGISVQANGVGADDLRYHARGFPVENLLVDGDPVRFDGFSAVSPDTLMYDRVEVVRGATGLTSGTGNPSASVSLVRKRPTIEPLLHIDLSAGNWSRYGMTIDASRALNAEGTVRGRVAARLQDHDSHINVVNVKNQTLYSIVEADLTPATVLGVGASWQRSQTDGVMWGLPTDRNGNLLDYARSTFYGSNWSTAEREGTSLFADLRHQFDSGWQVKVSAQQLRNRSDYIAPFYWQNATWDGPYTVSSIFGSRNRQKESTFNVAVDGQFQSFGRHHDVHFGLNTRRRDNEGSGSFNASLLEPGNLTVLDPSGIQNLPAPGPITLTTRTPTITEEQSLLASTRLRLTDRLSAILGTRLTWYDQDTGTTRYKLSGEWTPYAGVVFDLDAQHSLYASYTRILQPQYAFDASGKLLDPITGTNIELGVKGEYYGGRLNTSLSVFQMLQRNRAMADEDGPSPCPATGSTFCSRAAGEVETKGFEAIVSGEPLRGLNTSLGYTFSASEYTKDAVAANIGQPFNTRLPRHQVKLFSHYRLPGAWQRWSVGGSINGQSSMYNGTIQQGSFWTAGMLVGYRVSDRLSVRVNVDNVFDRKYYEALGYVRATYGSNNWFGAPRNVTVNLRYEL